MERAIRLNRKLILEGTVLENSYVNLSSNGRNLFVYIYDKNVTFADAFNLLNNPAKTSTIISEQSGDWTTYNGFVELVSIRKEDSGFIAAGLRKPYDT